MADRADQKIAIAVDGELAVWQKLNVVAFLTSGIAADHPDYIGADYEDADGNRYLPLLGLPVMCFQGDLEDLRKTRARALQRGLSVAVYTRDMLSTGNDTDNRAVVKAVPATELELIGIGLFGPRRDVDKALKGLKLHS